MFISGLITNTNIDDWAGDHGDDMQEQNVKNITEVFETNRQSMLDGLDLGKVHQR